jgi:hypothetical protein
MDLFEQNFNKVFWDFPIVLIARTESLHISGVTGPKTCVGIRIKFSCATTVTTNPLKSWNINHSGKSILWLIM